MNVIILIVIFLCVISAKIKPDGRRKQISKRDRKTSDSRGTARSGKTAAHWEEEAGHREATGKSLFECLSIPISENTTYYDKTCLIVVILHNVLKCRNGKL